MKINKTILFAPFLLLIPLTMVQSCDGSYSQRSSNSESNKKVINEIIIKKKYSESDVTKDLLFNTGNWHSIDYYVVDINNNIHDVSRDVFIICNEKDTLYENEYHAIYLTKEEANK